MGSERSRDVYRALLVPWPEIATSNLWAAQSSYTQAGPTAGVPEAQQDSDLVLQARGDQSASATLEVRALRAGFPMRDGGAGILWRQTGDTYWRGWDPPAVITGWQPVAWTDGTGLGIQVVKHPHAITLADGTVLCAVQTTWGSGNPTRIGVYARSASAGTWSGVVVHSESSTPGHDLYPCLVELPSGRVQLYHWIIDATRNEAQVRMWYSDDSGASWSLGQSHCLRSPVDLAGAPGPAATGYDLGRLRGGYNADQVLLLANLQDHDNAGSTRETLAQWASSDLGATFATVVIGDPTATQTGGPLDVVTVDGLFVVAVLDGGTNKVAVRRLATAYQSFFSATEIDTADSEVWGQQTTKVFTDADIAACADEAGVIYILGRQPSVTGDPCIVERSLDGGLTWSGIGQSSTTPTGSWSVWFNCLDGDTHPARFSATFQRGRIVVLSGHEANPGDEDNSLSAIYLGGYSTVTMPGYQLYPTDTSRVGFEFHYLPLDLPGACGWTAAGAGTETIETDGTLHVTCAAAAMNYTRNPLGSVTEGLIVMVDLATISGGSLATDAVAVRLRLADGVSDYDVSIRFAGASGIRVYDNNGAAQVGSDIALDTAAGVQILIAMSGASLAVWARATGLGHDREWTAGPTSSSLTTDGATPAANHMVAWGTLIAATCEWKAKIVQYVNDQWTGQQLVDVTLPDDLLPRSLASDWIWLDDGVEVRGVDGPALRDEEWQVSTRYSHPVERLHCVDVLSPRHRWRATGTAQTDFAWALEPGSTTKWVLPPVWALYLTGCNWRSGDLSIYDGGWSSIATIDLASDRASLPYVREGSTIRPNPASTSTGAHWIDENELVGHTVDLGGGKLRRVRRNTAGVWTVNASGAYPTLPPMIVLEGVDGTEAASGTCNIWATSALLIFRRTLATQDTAGFRLRIDSQSTVDGYLEGKALLGELRLLSKPYSWGRIIEHVPNVRRRYALDGVGQHRQLGPTRRRVRLDWTDGIIERPLRGQDPSPDYALATSTSGAMPAAARDDIASVVPGLLDRLLGGVLPVVYCPVVGAGSSGDDESQIVRAGHAVYGTLDGDVRLDHVQGEEHEGELVRLSFPPLIEEV